MGSAAALPQTGRLFDGTLAAVRGAVNKHKSRATSRRMPAGTQWAPIDPAGP